MISLSAIWVRIKQHPLSRVGPGLVTGVADDDPSGIVTYSQAGAQFGFNMLWTMPFAYPLMSTIQVLCARIGRVTGREVSFSSAGVDPISQHFIDCEHSQYCR